MFDCAWKINFLENIFSWPCVLVSLTRKWFKVKIFSSNHFRTHAHREREREREENITPSTSTLHRSRLRLRTDCTPGSHRDGTDRTEIAPISLFPDLVSPSFVDRIWWIFFFIGFCFCVYLLRNCIIYLFGSWENMRKMWGTRRKYVFYIIFNNTIKH